VFLCLTAVRRYACDNDKSINITLFSFVLTALTSTLESAMLAEHLKKTGEGALAELKNLESCRCVINDLKKNDELMSLKDAKLGHAKRIDSLMLKPKEAEGALAKEALAKTSAGEMLDCMDEYVDTPLAKEALAKTSAGEMLESDCMDEYVDTPLDVDEWNLGEYWAKKDVSWEDIFEGERAADQAAALAPNEFSDEGAHDDEGAQDELQPKAKTIDDDLDELFGCAFVKPPVQQVNAEAEEAADALARKRTIDAVMACATFDEMCLAIASGPPPTRSWQRSARSYDH
jgi:hypothetical protein